MCSLACGMQFGVGLLDGDFVLINIVKLTVEGNIWVINCKKKNTNNKLKYMHYILF